MISVNLAILVAILLVQSRFSACHRVPRCDLCRSCRGSGVNIQLLNSYGRSCVLEMAEILHDIRALAVGLWGVATLKPRLGDSETPCT